MNLSKLYVILPLKIKVKKGYDTEGRSEEGNVKLGSAKP